MAKVEVHYANFDHYGVTANRWGVSISTGFFFGSKQITGANIARIEAATTQSVKRFGAATSWGIVGGAVAGPLGMVAGAFLGGNGNDTTFTLETEDGDLLIGTVATNVFIALVREKLRFDELKLPDEPTPEMERVEREFLASQEQYERERIALAKDKDRPIELLDEEMDSRIWRVLHEEDYRAWKERTGENHDIRSYAERTKFVIPEGMML